MTLERDKTKIIKETKEFMVYVQGNKNLEYDSLLKALQKLCDMIEEICGGTYNRAILVLTLK